MFRPSKALDQRTGATFGFTQLPDVWVSSFIIFCLGCCRHAYDRTLLTLAVLLAVGATGMSSAALWGLVASCLSPASFAKTIVYVGYPCRIFAYFSGCSALNRFCRGFRASGIFREFTVFGFALIFGHAFDRSPENV